MHLPAFIRASKDPIAKQFGNQTTGSEDLLSPREVASPALVRVRQVWKVSRCPSDLPTTKGTQADSASLAFPPPENGDFERVRWPGRSVSWVPGRDQPSAYSWLARGFHSLSPGKSQQPHPQLSFTFVGWTAGRVGHWAV